MKVIIEDKRMHWLYFICIGWMVGSLAVCCIFPLFVNGMVAKAYGYW